MTEEKSLLFCPLNMACQVLQPRWTIQILAEMWWGSSRFNELRRGIPKISPTLLTKRLKELEANGLIDRVEDDSTGTVVYVRTPAAIELEPVIQALGNWAYRNTGVDNETSSADAKTFVWSCLRRGINTLALPAQRIIFKLTFPEQAPADRMYWVICKPGHPVDVCYVDPGFDVDLFINTSLNTLVSVYFGHSKLLTEIDADRITLIGKLVLSRSISRWLTLSSYACQKEAGTL
ncbi:MAG: DNA-binding HxlR family transcriptional regulator [Gammaproteobacteria bacterium]|jgi:DNA-binding HxlR family transcriptional regulator